jgi:c-di-GMP-binding flagellar brake protein YcgR
MVEEFLRGLAGSFARNRAALPAVELTLLALVALGVLLQLGAMAGRWWGRRTRLHRLARQLGISGPDLAFAQGLARKVQAAPLAFLTRLDLFERATAQALAGGGPGGAEVAEPVRRLRRALGFDRLPAHTPLLTSRELAPGTAVEVGLVHGQAFDVDETRFSVRLREAVGLRPGQEAMLALIHAREARYELRCRVLESLGAGEDGSVLVLAHDEEPRRVQQREYARVPVRGAVALQPLAPWPLHPGVRLDVVARLLDVSGGGALIASREPLPVGLLAQATFTLGGVRFEKLQAVVVSSEALPDGQCRVRLEWRKLREAARDRLVSVVMRLERPRDGELEPRG